MKENTNYYKILKMFEENYGYITREDTDEANIPSWFLSDFVKKKNLNKIAPGFYASDDFALDEYYILQKRYPKFIFSGMSALYLHRLTDKIPAEMCVSAPQGYNPTRNKIDSLSIRRISSPEILNLGISTVDTMFGNKVQTYDEERTICDLIKYRDKYDSETFVKAVKTYAKGKPNQGKLFKYAKTMKIEKKVFDVMEVVMNES